MRSIAGLFGKSPFGSLQAHAVKVNACVELLRPLLEALFANDDTKVGELVERINDLEQEADGIKNDLRDSLPRSLFLPAARSDLLVLLEVLDSVADAAQDVAILVGVRKFAIPPDFKEDLYKLVDFATVSSKQILEIFERLHDLLESTFRGKPAEQVSESIRSVGRAEHGADKVALSLMKRLYNMEDTLSFQDFLILDKIVFQLGKVSDFSRKAANRIRVILAR